MNQVLNVSTSFHFDRRKGVQEMVISQEIKLCVSYSTTETRLLVNFETLKHATTLVSLR